MKKILFVALVAAAMVSCSENEEFDNESTNAEIKFGTVVKTGTKAVVPTTTDNLSTFTVNGYKTTDAMGTEVQLATGFMDNIVVTKNGQNWENADNKVFYWPVSGNVQFFATSPAQTLNITATGYPKFDYTVKAVGSQEDLVAANVIDQTKTKAAGKAIALPFSHLLTQVNFSIKGDAVGFTYTVSKLVIKGAKDKATFTFNGTEKIGSWSTATASVADLTYEYTGSASVTPTSGMTESTALETSGNALFMLMPQDASAITLDVTYTAAPKDAPTEYTWNATKTVSLTGTWGMGKNIRYTLTLTNDATPVEFTPTVNIWTDENGTIK